MSLWMVLLAACCSLAAANMPTLHHNDEQENIIANTERKLVHRPRDWVKVTLAPNAVTRGELGARVELECEVMGSPPPAITWVKGSRSNIQSEEYSNSRMSDGTGLAKTKSRLIIDCLMPHDEGLYTCLATSGVKTALATPSMVFIQGNSVNNLTALLTACPEEHHGDLDNDIMSALHAPAQRQHAPRVAQWRPVVMETVGNDVTMPCNAAGFPEPSVDWFVGDEMVAVDTQPRFKVLSNGDLVIVKLRWSDMGGYTCVASNTRGRDSVETFLYPLLKESS